MNTITAASCCCDQTPGPFDPCSPPTAGSAIKLTWQVQTASKGRARLFTCGECFPCTPSSCTPVDFGAMEPDFNSCVWSLTAVPGGPACSYMDYTFEGNAASSMPEPWSAVLPYVATISNIGLTFWYTPDGMLTDFLAASRTPQYKYEGVVAMPRRTQQASRNRCTSVQTDPACTKTLTATFRGWPAYTSGPTVFRIRRATSTSTARIWEVVARTFQIKNASNVVLWSTPLAGKTFAQLLAAVNAQTTARVTMTWATTTTPTAFSQGLSAETYFADQAYTTTNIPTSTQAPSDIRMFTLTNEQPLPDPQPGQCGSAHRLLGWDTPIGGAYLYDSINTALQYGRGLCSRALADEMCAGVGFIGQNNYYDSLNRPWEEIIDPYVYLEGNDHFVCQPAASTLARSGDCCGASWSLGLACAEFFPAVSFCMDQQPDTIGRSPFLSGNMRCGPLAQSTPFQGTTVYGETELIQTGEVDFSPCCPVTADNPSGAECSAGYEHSKFTYRVFAWSKVERIA